MRFITRSLSIVEKLFPQAYQNKTSYKAFHFAFLYEGNRLLSIGQNDYAFNKKALNLAQKFSIREKIRYPSLHAEIDAISRVWGKYYVGNSTTLVVIRVNKFGELQNSRPCKSCLPVIQALNISRVWYSTPDGIINENIQTGEIRGYYRTK